MKQKNGELAIFEFFELNAITVMLLELCLIQALC